MESKFSELEKADQELVKFLGGMDLSPSFASSTVCNLYHESKLVCSPITPSKTALACYSIALLTV